MLLPCMCREMFQFTHPGRGATLTDPSLSPAEKGFNSRTPGGVRLIAGGVKLADVTFQFTHPGRGATSVIAQNKYIDEFQFTHPGRGATVA